MDCELLYGYSIYRRGWEGSVGGGVLFAIETDLQAFRRFDLEKENAELIVVEIKTLNCFPVILYTFIARLVLHLRFFIIWTLRSNAKSSRTVLVGDVNLLSIDWSTDLPVSLGTGSHAMDDIFCELVADNYLQQFVTGPTHIYIWKQIRFFLCVIVQKLSQTFSLQHRRNVGFQRIIKFQNLQSF